MITNLLNNRVFKVTGKQSASPRERSILDLHRGGMSTWSSEQNEACNLSFSFPSDELSWENHVALTDWFVESIAQSRLADCNVDILLPRCAVCLHLLELPAADDAQLEGMIQIQVEALYGDRTNSIVFDYSPLNWSSTAGSDRHILLATIPKALQESLQQLCTDAGLVLSRMLIRDLVLNHALPQDDHINFVTWLDDHSRTIGVAIGNQVIQSISIPAGLQLPSVELFRGYERRLLQSLPGKYREQKIGQRLASITISDSTKQQEASTWAKTVGLEQQLCNPIEFCRNGDSTKRTSTKNSLHTIDFCHPYNAKPARSLRGPIMIAASIAVLGLGALWAYQQRMRSLGEAQLLSLRQQVSDLQSELDELKEPVQQYELARKWHETRVYWGQELVLISERSSAAKNAYLYRLQMDSFDAERLPVVRMDGRATSVPDAMNWNRQLAKLTGRYSIQPQSLDSAVTDPEYPTQFRIEAQLTQKSLIGGEQSQSNDDRKKRSNSSTITQLDSSEELSP